MGERGRPRYPDVLTPRQAEVLELVREGLTNPQIGERLGISPDGAKWHVKEIMWRLGVRSREEAAEWGRERRERAPTALFARWAELRFRGEAGGWKLDGRRLGRRSCRMRRRPWIGAGIAGAVA